MNTIAGLGHLVVRGPIAEWREFGTEILGMQLVDGLDESTIAFRTDERAFRLVVEDGPPGPDSLVALGFEAASVSAFENLVARLRGQGIEVTEDSELANRRRVRRLAVFNDIDGNRVELHIAPESRRAPFVSPRGVQFVCGDLGLGHVFVLSQDPQRSVAFYEEMLGFLLSDTISLGPQTGIFLHCNPRHHTIAFASIPGVPAGLNHLMVEVNTLETVGRALDIVQDGEHPIVMSMGEHTNDRMTSFYVQTPSGFAVEYGCNGRLIDDAVWKPEHHDAPSLWGHHFSPRPAMAAEGQA